MESLALLTDGILTAWRNLPLGPVERSVVRALIIGAALFAVIYALERICAAPRSQYASRSFRHDVAYWFYYRSGLHYFIFLAALFGVLAEYLPSLDTRFLNSLPFSVQAVLYMVAADFLVYWIHRAQHRFKFLWAFHTTHHSQEQLNFVTSQRVHPIEHFVQDILIYVSLRMMGFNETAWIPLYILGEFSLAAQHSRIPWRYGFLYPWIVSPAFHAYHHSVDSRHHDRNFAGIFSLWDYLFGTAVKDKDGAPTRFGLADVESKTLADTIVVPFMLLRRFYPSRKSREV